MKDNCKTLLGAINSKTNQYILPIFAEKVDIDRNKLDYFCPNCEECVILKKGNILRHHFSHKSNSKCGFYNHPGESEIHKGAKMLLKKLIEDGLEINIKITYSCCNKNKIYKLPLYDNNSKVITEYSFKYNEKNKKADVAYINTKLNKMFIFEIYHTNVTLDKDRPEPWYEINADELSNIDIKHIELNCCRNNHKICKTCLKNFTVMFERITDNAGFDKRMKKLKKYLCDSYYNNIRSLLVKCIDDKGILKVYINNNKSEDIINICNKMSDLWSTKFYEPNESIVIIDNNGKDYSYELIKCHCDICNKFHYNEHGICDMCNKEHYIKSVNRCLSCKIGICDDCDIYINPKFKKCYNCENKTGKISKEHHTSQEHINIVKIYKLNREIYKMRNDHNDLESNYNKLDNNHGNLKYKYNELKKKYSELKKKYDTLNTNCNISDYEYESDINECRKKYLNNFICENENNNSESKLEVKNSHSESESEDECNYPENGSKEENIISKCKCGKNNKDICMCKRTQYKYDIYARTLLCIECNKIRCQCEPL